MASQRLRAEAWKQTQIIYSNKPDSQSELINKVPSNNEMLSLTRFPSTVVEFMKGDAIEVACVYSYNGASVTLVCDAMWDSHSKMLDHGFMSQEADCYRRSDYHKHLQIEKYYPLGPLDTFLSKDVEFSRVGLDKQYFFIDKPIYMNIVTAPAVDHPNKSHGGKLFASQSDEEMMENKIRIMLYAAAKSGANYLIVPAWGCKEHRCPAYHIGALFHKFIQENNGLFVRVIFAIEGALLEEFKTGFSA
jgi:uncharacterized protein (TIGR02452 family)